jgi:type IV pilus assembly protein PilV
VLVSALRSQQRGVGLLEPLIAIVILAFGVLGLAKFQLAMVTQTTDAQARLTATAAAEDLLTQMHVDASNAACYQLPAAGACSSPFALSQASSWATRVQQGLPGFVSATSAISGNLFTVTLRWTGKTGNETRTHTVSTDVRP